MDITPQCPNQISQNPKEKKSRWITATKYLTLIMIIAAFVGPAIAAANIRPLRALPLIMAVIVLVSTLAGMCCGLMAIISLILSRGKKQGWIITIICLFLCLAIGLEFSIPLIGSYNFHTQDIITYVRENSRLPNNEQEYLGWQKSNDFTEEPPPFNISYNCPVADLEIQKGKLVYKKTGEPCRLIDGGKNSFFDLCWQWRYDKTSRELFELIQSTNPKKSDEHK